MGEVLMTIEGLIKHVHDRCVEEGECWIWRMALDGTAPIMRMPGTHECIPVRRALLEAAGKRIEGLFATVKCTTRRCVAPHHVIAVTRAELQQLTADRTGYHQGLARRAKLSAASKARNGLTEDQIAIIMDSDASGRSIARKLGISLSTVQNHRNGKVFKAGNPFAWLMDSRR